MSSHEVINQVLVDLYNEIWELEEKAIISGEFVDISNNDMHIIERIGIEEGDNMSSIAKKLKITVGSLTTAMNNLVNKGYVVRERSEQDRRVVYIQLTEKGKRAYHHHAKFHEAMTNAAVAHLKEEELPILVKTLKGLSEFFQSMQ